jgi:hypothetical protein
MLAPEILAGGLTGLSLLNGIVTVTLENPRADHGRPDPSLERVIVGRIGMPIPTAQALLCGLYQFLSQHQVNPGRGNGDALPMSYFPLLHLIGHKRSHHIALLMPPCRYRFSIRWSGSSAEHTIQRVTHMPR